MRILFQRMKVLRMTYVVLPFFCFFYNDALAAAKINKVSVSPTTASAGKMFKFSATLSTALGINEFAKIDLGNGLATMSCVAQTCTLSRAGNVVGTRTYKIGVYNSSNTLQGTVSGGTYTVTTPVVSNYAPGVSLVAGGGDWVAVGTTFSITLNATDRDKNLDAITVDWGDKSVPDKKIAVDSKDLVFTHEYQTVGTFEWTATAVDKGTPALVSQSVSGKLDVKKIKANNYTKVCNSGALAGEEDCPSNPVLGNKSTNWGCSKDNDTGLIWEVKTADGGLRDWKKSYTNYGTDVSTSLFQAEDNANGFVLDVNDETLCGASDWRLPTSDEVATLVYCSDNNYGSLLKEESGFICSGNATALKTIVPTVNDAYFPNTVGAFYWTSTPSGVEKTLLGRINFYNGRYDWNDYGLSGKVRLVRDTK